MRIAVVDTETTGDSEQDQVCELAVATVDAETQQMILGRDQLVKPTCSMNVIARAVHHITDDQLKHAPTMAKLMARNKSILTEIKTSQYVAMHYADFDLRMLEQSGYKLTQEAPGVKVICTWRASRHLWPDAPRHSNQVLRYWLDLAVPYCIRPPHRAMPDALTTATLVLRMLTLKTADELVQLTNTPYLQRIIGFGKYKGMEWRHVREIDRSYLSWILRQEDFGEEERYVAEFWNSKPLKDVLEMSHDDAVLLQLREAATSGVPEPSGGEVVPDEGPDPAEVQVHERLPGAGQDH